MATLHAPDDAMLRAVIVKLAADRQLVLDESVVRYVATRIERSFAAARTAVITLDDEALRQGPATRAPCRAVTERPWRRAIRMAERPPPEWNPLPRPLRNPAPPGSRWSTAAAFAGVAHAGVLLKSLDVALRASRRRSRSSSFCGPILISVPVNALRARARGEA